MDIKTILDNLCGRNDKGESRAQTGCYLYEYALDNPETHREIGSSITDIPDIHVYPNGDVVQIDLTFLSEADTDFYKMNELIKRRLESEANNKDKGYMLVFNVLPTSVDKGDTGYMELFNPILTCITPLAPKQPALTLRMIFLADNVQFYESDFDTTNVAIEANYEVKKRQEAEFYANQKRSKNNSNEQYMNSLREKYKKEF